MPLTCGCDSREFEGGDIVYYTPDDYAPLRTRRRQRCMSCRTLIDLGALACRVERFKVPETEMEAWIYGEDGEVPRADQYLCERCSDIYWSLKELKFCVGPWEKMEELLLEYRAIRAGEENW